jgi:hypothetical protein
MAVLLAASCGQDYFPDALDATLTQVDEVRNSDTLEPQEMRDELADYGIDPVTINGLLVGIRLANQFGGDLSSAHEKVDDNKLSQMTPDEVQFYADATEQTPEELSDAEALAIAELFRGNDIDSQTELEEWLDNSANELPAEIDEDNLRGVFIDTSTDDVLDEL